MNARIALAVVSTLWISIRAGADGVPGVVVDRSPDFQKVYVGCPGIAILPDGRYVASHSWFGPGTSNDTSEVFGSEDRGATWRKAATLRGQWWSSLFVHRGSLYIMGVDREYGRIVIRRSNDGGTTWTEPCDANSGLLTMEDGYHCAPVPVALHGGRIWRAFELAAGPRPEWSAFVLSAPVDADLLLAANWRASEKMQHLWSQSQWIEGNVLVAPDGSLVNVLRTNGKAAPDRAAIVHVDDDGLRLSHDRSADAIDFPGGGSKFTIRFDPKTRRYWSLGNKQSNPPAGRNVLALTSSSDLRTWTVHTLVLRHADSRFHAWQYVDWVFDGEDIAAVSRTAWDGSHNYHDANYLTFHRIANFRARTMADSSPVLSEAVRRAKPDILLIMPDQMRGDCLSVLGHPAVRTPHIDALAREGVLFRKAYSTVPSCIPARYALLTGTSPQASGVVGFSARPITTPTLPGLLAGAGYATVLVGRNMHQRPESGDAGYQRQILGSTYVKDDDYDVALKKALPDSGGIRGVVDGLRLNNNRWPAAAWPLPGEWHPTAWIVQQSRRVVGATPGGQPLFLTASFYAPHPPLFPPPRYFDAHMTNDLPGPARGGWVDWAALSPEGDKQGHRIRLEGEMLRRAQAGYYGLIEHIDAEIAPLVAEFKARSEKAGRPWVIAVTSDHGEMLGDHGYFRKCEPYEGSANIPFIIAGSPSLGFKAGTRPVQPVCLEDLLPTLVALAGEKKPDAADGLNLTPVLRGEGRVPRDWLHFEHAPCYGPPQAFHALTDGRFKYIWRPADGSEQLFDLARDPAEEDDLSKTPAAGPWRRRLVERLAGRPEGFSDGMRLIAGRPYPAVQKR